jgi:hypothetical protein
LVGFEERGGVGDASGERLLSAVRRTLEGESPLNQELAMRLLVRLARESGGSLRRGMAEDLGGQPPKPAGRHRRIGPG